MDVEGPDVDIFLACDIRCTLTSLGKSFGIFNSEQALLSDSLEN